MIKGCQRKMIMIRGGANEVFESAYFVIRPGRELTGDIKENDMVSEAVKIINGAISDTSTGQGKKQAKPRHAALWSIGKFLAGTVFGAGLALLIAVLLYRV